MQPPHLHRQHRHRPCQSVIPQPARRQQRQPARPQRRALPRTKYDLSSKTVKLPGSTSSGMSANQAERCSVVYPCSSQSRCRRSARSRGEASVRLDTRKAMRWSGEGSGGTGAGCRHRRHRCGVFWGCCLLLCLTLLLWVPEWKPLGVVHQR
jgi:hypothetical protein